MTESRKRELTKVGELIDRVLGQVASAGVAPIVRLRAQWPELAGEWAARSAVVGLREGVLTVEVRSGMDASMLRYDTASLLESVRKELGPNADLDRIAIRVRPAT